MFQADSITSERKNRRALSFWRVVAILALMISFVTILVTSSKTGSRLAKYSEHIARVRLDGLITGDQKTIALLGKIAKSSSVKAVIVRINSPGGTTVGSEALYEAIRKLAKKKPVVTVMDSLAASGGYIAALAGDRIVAHQNTITGSIGVIFQWPEVYRLLDKVGVKMRTIKSGVQKAEPNIYAPFNETEVRPVLEAMVKDSYDWFVDLVAKRRRLDREKVLKLADGRVYSGRQAIKNALIDELGGEEVALKWLQKNKKISKKLRVTDWAVPTAAQKVGLSLSTMQHVANALGFGQVARDVGLLPAGDAQKLDGLLAVWQPALR